MGKGNIVFSTDPDWKEKCHVCQETVKDCLCENKEKNIQHNQTIYIQRDRKKRKGKTVTIITNLKGDLKSLKKELQKYCGAGGTEKGGVIEIQGDHREKIQDYLQKKGYSVKLSGG